MSPRPTPQETTVSHFNYNPPRGNVFKMHRNSLIRPLGATFRRQTTKWVPLRVPRPQTRALHLAPPFLLEDYTPRFMTLSSRDASMKRSAAYAHLRNCKLCPRLCGVNRYETTGMCEFYSAWLCYLDMKLEMLTRTGADLLRVGLVGEKAKVNVIAPHFGEGKCPQLCCVGGIMVLGRGC
jgi:hypothetical protein